MLNLQYLYGINKSPVTQNLYKQDHNTCSVDIHTNKDISRALSDHCFVELFHRSSIQNHTAITFFLSLLLLFSNSQHI